MIFHHFAYLNEPHIADLIKSKIESEKIFQKIPQDKVAFAINQASKLASGIFGKEIVSDSTTAC